MSPEVPKRKFAGSELIAGKTYRVLREFTDYDGLPHAMGETWSFISHNFVPNDDGLTLYIGRDGRTVPLRLQWRTETQGHIVSEFFDYVKEL